MFIDPDTVPANFPPISMQEPQAGGITRSFEKLARPIAAMAQRGSVRLIEIVSIMDAPRKPVHAVSLRLRRTLPVHFANRLARMPDVKHPMPPQNSGTMPYRAI